MHPPLKGASPSTAFRGKLPLSDEYTVQCTGTIQWKEVGIQVLEGLVPSSQTVGSNISVIHEQAKCSSWMSEANIAPATSQSSCVTLTLPARSQISPSLAQKWLLTEEAYFSLMSFTQMAVRANVTQPSLLVQMSLFFILLFPPFLQNNLS